MEVITTIKELRARVKIYKNSHKEEKVIGFVPTMGYFHDGHESLIKHCVKNSDLTIVSIFVNPTQFAPNEDYARYPRDFERDKTICIINNVDFLFCPDVTEMYPNHYRSYVKVKELSEKLCGLSRPTHFEGVCTIVIKLLNIVQPTYLYLGQKDIQQAIILDKMIEDLNMPVKIKLCPIIRDKNGLALSSRNKYLNEKERKSGACLYKSLELAKSLISNGITKASVIKEKMTNLINGFPFTKIDYIDIVDPINLETLKTVDDEYIIALAVYVGKTRLIDNISKF